MKKKCRIKITLNDLDREQLNRWLQSSKASKRVAARARIILDFDRGKSAAEVAESLGVSVALVYRWVSRYREKGLDGVRDCPRPGRPSKLTEQEVEGMVRSAMKKSPSQKGPWSIRSVARVAGVSKWQVEKVWKKKWSRAQSAKSAAGSGAS